ncbi:MAG TPA: type II secretion system major pseudopilin GspG [Gammaproteobacteria bacterium]|jgi:general secretion pathway protein G
MLDLSARSPKTENGFTLIEIMVVVVIIGLLAAMIAPNIMRQLDRAEINRARQDVRSIESALDLYRLDNYRYPSTEEGLKALVTNPGETIAPNWVKGGYLKSMPEDPWNREYLYLQPGQHGEFDVYTLGADGQEGGEDNNADIGNWDLN